MFVVTKSGKKLPVDDSSIDYENEYVPFQETVGLYTDDVVLKPVWILELSRTTRDRDEVAYKNGTLLDFVAEIEFDHEPTPEEILFAMTTRGLTRYDYVFVRKGFALDMD